MGGLLSAFGEAAESVWCHAGAVTDDVVRVVTRSGGRRWRVLLWFEMEPLADGLYRDSLTSGGYTFDPSYEYRVKWDPERDLWRLDRRRSADGG